MLGSTDSSRRSAGIIITSESAANSLTIWQELDKIVQYMLGLSPGIRYISNTGILGLIQYRIECKCIGKNIENYYLLYKHL